MFFIVCFENFYLGVLQPTPPKFQTSITWSKLTRIFCENIFRLSSSRAFDWWNIWPPLIIFRLGHFWPQNFGRIFHENFQKIITFFNDTLLNCFKVQICVENCVLFSENNFPDIQFQKPQNISKKPKFSNFSKIPPYTPTFKLSSLFYISKNF